MKMLHVIDPSIFKGTTHDSGRLLKRLAVALTVALAAMLLTPSSWAQSEAPPPPPIREPLPPKVVAPEDSLDQEVVIRQEEDRNVEEYRRGGQVYMVRIVPNIGQPYYLIDTTGDGLLDLKHETFEPVKPVYWRLFEW